MAIGQSTSWSVILSTHILCVLICTALVHSIEPPTTISSTNPEVDECSPLDKANNICTDQTTTSGLCLKGIESGQTALQKFIKLCKDNTKLDIVFMVDRSKSIGCNAYQCSIDLIKSLIQYLSSTGSLVIGKYHSHVTVITYGVHATIEYDGVGEGQQADQLTSCSIESKFPTKIVHADGSALTSALERAETVFQKGRGLRNDQDMKQVMLLVADGEDTLETRATDVAKNISSEKVTIFGMGQDQWMTQDRENSLISLSSDKEHYACRQHWNAALGELQNETTNLDKVHVRAEGISEGSCSADICDHDCACEVISLTYECHSFPTTTGPSTVIPTTTSIEDDLPSWLWPVVGGGAGLLLLILLICCCCLCCRSRNNDPPPYPGPDLPTPPVPRRRRKLEIMGAENVYGNAEDEDLGYSQPDMNATNEFCVVPDYEVFHEVDHDLPGWTDFLVEEIKMKNLLHLGVHNMNKERWSMTPGVKVQRKEVKDIYKIFVDPKATRKSKPKIDLKLAGNRYRIDMGESCEGGHIIASRKMKNGSEQIAVVVREEHYLLVGIANADLKLVLLASCQDLSSHFQGIYGTQGL